MSDAMFLWGVFRYAPLLETVLGGDCEMQPAALEGYAVHFPLAGSDPQLIRQPDGVTDGVLIAGMPPAMRVRLWYFLEGLGGSSVEAEVSLLPGGGRVLATVWMPPHLPSQDEVGALWDIDAWIAQWGDIWVEAAHEAMDALSHGGQSLVGRWEMMKQRGATRVRAGQVDRPSLRADFAATKDVEVITPRRPYTEYFTLTDHDLRFRRFDGSMSPKVRRAGFVGGDAATVLPYDPVSDSVLVVEQFRAGPLMRGDPHPWTLEPIAGRIDPGELPEDAIHREALEEAGLEIGELFAIGNYYPSPGAVTEFVYSYIGLADLAGRGGEIGGVDHEDEDIRTHVLSFERLMELITAGEVNTGPLILSAYWLAQNRAGLRPSG
ncbi:MAG: NUDIX domain-containing protein [Maritimibacter sp.]